MTKKILGSALLLVIVAGIGGYLFRAPLMEALVNRITQNMFVPGDQDSYDPGPAIGQRLPTLRATYQNREVTQLEQFAGPNGTVLYINRSVDW
jgi:hypothetical protein